MEHVSSPGHNARVRKVNNAAVVETESSQHFQDNFMLPQNGAMVTGVGAQHLQSQNQVGQQPRRVINNVSKEKINKMNIGQHGENQIVDSQIQNYKVPVKLRRSVAGGMTRNPNINPHTAGSNSQLPQLQQNSMKITNKNDQNTFLHRNQTISKEREMPKIHSAQSEEGRGLLEVRLMSEEQQRRKKMQGNGGGNRFVQSPQFSQPATTKPNAEPRAISNFYKEYKPQNTIPIGNKYAHKIVVSRGDTASISGRRTIGTPICQEQPPIQKLNSEKQPRDAGGTFENAGTSLNKQQTMKQPGQKFKNLNEFMQTQYKLLSSQQSSFQGQMPMNVHSSQSLQQNHFKNLQTDGQTEGGNLMMSNSNIEQAAQANTIDLTPQRQNEEMKKQDAKIDQLQQFINLVDLSNNLELEQRKNVNLSPEMSQTKLNVTFTNNGSAVQELGVQGTENQYATQQKFYNHKQAQIKSKSQNPQQPNQQNHFFHLNNNTIQKSAVNRNQGDVKKMLNVQQQKLIQNQSSNQANNSKVDQNIWLNFKHLLSLENNEQLTHIEKQALASIQSQIQSKNVNEQQININLKNFLENYNLNNNGSETQNLFQQNAIKQGLLSNYKNNTTFDAKQNMHSPSTSNPRLHSVRQNKIQTEINFNNQTQQAAKIQQAISEEMMLDSGTNSALKVRKSPVCKQFHEQTQNNKSKDEHHQSALQKGIQEVSENIQRLTDHCAGKRQENREQKPQSNGMKMMNNDQSNPYKDNSSGQQPTININKLNVNIQQFQNPGVHSNNGQSAQGENSFSQKTSIGSFVQQVPMSMRSTLFIMDCQTLGLLSNQKLLNLEQQKQMPFSQDLREQSLSEVQIINFIQSRAEVSQTTLFKEMPKLSEDSKRILNTIKAQQHLNVIDEIPKLNTLLIEIDYLDYKNQLLQALFNIYGDKVLENLVHQIDVQSNNTQQIFNQFRQKNFQTIMEYMEKIRKHHSEQKQSMESSKISGNLFMTEKELQIMSSEEDWHEELELLFPKKLDVNINSNLNSGQSLDKLDAKKTPNQKQNKINKNDSKKYKKRINFHVVVKNTKLYRSLIYANLQFQFNHKQSQQKESINVEYEEKSQFQQKQLSSLSELSSFVLTQDPTLLRFVLFCQHVGIIKSAQSFLRHLFENIFIVIRPGQRNLSNGSIQHLLELPRIDVEKINKYLEQQQQKRDASEAAQKMINHQQSPSRMINNTYVIGQNITVNQKSNLMPSQPQVGGQKNKSQTRYNNKQEDRIQTKSTLSLNSYKSHSLLDQQQQKQQMQTMSLAFHFNSLQSSIKTELPQPHLIPTIQVFHKSFSHHDNSKIQKCFKIYNEFIQLTFKNKIIHQQNDNSHVNQDFSKLDQMRILKLGQNMGIKNLPKRQSILRTPLLDCFKNHRSLAKIKEQMMRFVHRVLNEENGIPHTINKCLVIGQGFTIEQTKEISKQDKDGQQTNAQEINDTISQGLSSLIIQQKQNFYKYQVGYGNNHQLIKNLFKQRWWWHQINQGKEVNKLDFDEAQIMWTQWCKGRLYNHLSEYKQFNNDFKEIIELINQDSTSNQETQERQEIVNQNRLGKAERFQEKMRAYCQSTSPIRPEFNNRKRKISSFKVKKARDLINSTDHDGDIEDLNSPLNKDNSDQDNQIEEENYSGEDFDVQDKNQVKIPIKQTIQNPNLRNQIDQCKKQLQKIYNRLEFNQHLNNKKALFINMRNYYTYCCDNEDVFDTLPLTFHIKDGISDPQYEKFKKYYEIEKNECLKEKSRKNIWIVKPGENSNRGNGIKVEQNFGPLTSLVGQYCSPSQGRSCIMQKYIDNPLLYQKRKFDIRCFALVTCINGTMKAYFYRDGYIRTSSKEFNLNNLANKFVHLVNDAVQKYADDYGKFETANKLSYQDFQKYWSVNFPEMNINVERDLVMQVKKIVTDTIRATFHLLDSKKRVNSYELFGYDFMFDTKFKPYLIEVNSNPSLEVSSTLLAKLFTAMLDNTFRIAIDPLFPPGQEGFSMKKSAIGIELCPENRFDLIFDERIDGPLLLEKMNKIDKQEREEVEGINELEGSEDEPDDATPAADLANIDEASNVIAIEEKKQETEIDQACEE